MTSYSYMDKCSVLISYLFSLILFLNVNSMFTFWVFMELNLLMFISLLNFFSFSDECFTFKDIIIFYFFIQTLGSFLFLLSLVYLPSFNFSSSLMLVSLLLKLGMPPFHFWVYKIKNHLSNYTMGFLLTFQKFPLLIAMFSLASDWLFVVILISTIVGVLLMSFSDSISSLLISSSIYFSAWLMIFFLKSLGFFILVYLFYSLVVIMLLMCNTNLVYLSGFNTMIFFCCMYLLGLPPFSLFFFKFYSFDLLLSSTSGTALLALIFSAFMGLLSYLKFFFTMFMNCEVIYKPCGKILSNVFFLTCFFALLICVLS